MCELGTQLEYSIKNHYTRATMHTHLLQHEHAWRFLGFLWQKISFTATRLASHAKLTLDMHDSMIHGVAVNHAAVIRWSINCQSTQAGHAQRYVLYAAQDMMT